MNEITQDLIDKGVTIQDMTAADLRLLADSLGTMDMASIRIDKRIAAGYWHKVATRHGSS